MKHKRLAWAFLLKNVLFFFFLSVNLTMILPYILKLKDSTQIIWMLQGRYTYICRNLLKNWNVYKENIFLKDKEENFVFPAVFWFVWCRC